MKSVRDDLFLTQLSSAKWHSVLVLVALITLDDGKPQGRATNHFQNVPKLRSPSFLISIIALYYFTFRTSFKNVIVFRLLRSIINIQLTFMCNRESA